MSAKRTPIDAYTIQNVTFGNMTPIPTNSKYSVSLSSGAWFSPNQPISPVAQEKTKGRQFDYPVGFNTRIRPKDDSNVTFEELRALADNLDVLRLVIETRKDQIESYDWEVVIKEGRKATDEEIEEVVTMLDNPTREYNWSSWLRMILEELFVVDAVSILPRFTRGGKLYSLDLIDGTTIKRVIDESGRTPITPDPAYQQILKGVPATNYTADELIYLMRNPRVSKLYGFSQVEQIIMTVNIALRRQLTQLQYYTEGNIPEALVGVPDTWSPDQVRQFQMYFDSELEGNTATRSRLKFLPLDVTKIHETKDGNMKDVFDEWLARVVCYAFSVSSAPFVTSMNRATAESAQDNSMSEGLAPTLMFIKRMIDNIISTSMRKNNLEFKWKAKNTVKQVDQASIDKIYIDAGIKDINEVRSELGLKAKEVKVVEPIVKEPIVKEPIVKEPIVKEVATKSDTELEMLKLFTATNDAMLKLASREMPDNIINIDNTTHTNKTEVTEVKKSIKKISARRMPDGTLVATVEEDE